MIAPQVVSSSPVTPGGHGAVEGAAMTTRPAVNVDAGVDILYLRPSFFIE
jgi:hypothetical protein